MYKIKVASYKNSKSVFGKVIRLQQRLQGFGPEFAQFSHSEFVFCYVDDKEVCVKLNEISSIKNNLKPREEEFKEKNLWFSSSEQDWWTRFAFIEDNKNHWSYQDIEVTKEQYLALLDFYIERDWLPYAWWSIFFTQALKTLWFKSYKSLFCSETVLLWLQKVLKIMCWIDAVTCNPALLAYWVKNKICNFDWNKLK